MRQDPGNRRAFNGASRSRAHPVTVSATPIAAKKITPARIAGAPGALRVGATSEKALRELLDKRAIEELRFRYSYSILDKDVDRLVSLFTDDVKPECGFGIDLTGREEARDFFTRLLGSPDLLRQVPRGATASWS